MMRNALYLTLAVCLTTMLVGCQNKATTVDEKAISDMQLSDVRPVDVKPATTVNIGPGPIVRPAAPVVHVAPPTPVSHTIKPVAVAPAPPVEVEVIRPAAPTAGPPMNYTVAKGDNLTKISRRFYGDASMVKAIFAANRKVLKTPNLIKEGQKLFLPAKSASVRTISHRSTMAGTTPRARRVQPTTYKVKKGDSLFLIAKRIYGRGSKWTKIYNANKAKLKNPDRVREGMVLRIPS